jgi:ABC-2 type transport system permease protein
MQLRHFVHEMTASYGFVERNWALMRRYLSWEVVWLVYSTVTTLTIGLIGVSSREVEGQERVLYLLIGALLWTFLSTMFQLVGESVAWERWEGTIEYTFMAPVHRYTYLVGQAMFGITYSLFRTILILGLVILFFDLDMSKANIMGGLVALMVSSLSFLGMGLLAAVLPLLSPEKGPQATHIVQGLLLLCSSVYYPIEVLPAWMQPIAAINPATYTLDAIRASWIDGLPLSASWPQVWRLLATAVVLVPLGMVVFTMGERYSMKHGKLKRSG